MPKPVLDKTKGLPGRFSLPTSLLLPAAVVAVIVVFGVLIWLGSSGLDKVVSDSQKIVGKNLDSVVRITEIASRLQHVNATLYRLITDLFANGQTQPSSAIPSCHGRIGLTKRLKQTVDLLLCHSNARVAHRDDQGSRMRTARRLRGILMI